MSTHTDMMPNVTDTDSESPCCHGVVVAAVEFDRHGDDVLGTDHSDDCDNYDGAPLYREGMGPGDPVRCDND